MTDFLAMGGYAQYVWPSYFLTLIAVVANIISAHRAYKLERVAALRRLATQALSSLQVSQKEQSTGT